MVTRTAFEATLVVNNETADILEDFLVEVEVEDLAGNPASQLFAGFDLPTLNGFQNGGIDGTGDIPGNTTASVRWLLVPTPEAAPGTSSVKYSVRGRVRHKQQGIEVEVPLYPVEIEVFPDAALFLDYYLQRIVYSDNPFTPETEPAEPFSLGLIVRNAGHGDARNLRITSSQPRITDNPQQLLIAFQILGAQLGTGMIDPCLTVNFGDVPAGESAVARWVMSSSLQGRFTCISVDFEHKTNLGSDAISLIKDADIYWQTHTVELASPSLPPTQAYLDDGLPDFLVELDSLQPIPDSGEAPACGGSGLGDVEDPQEVHSSEGSRISVVRNGMVERLAIPSMIDLSVPIRVTITTPGWNYLRFPDPGKYSGTLPIPPGSVDLDLVVIDRPPRFKIRQIGGPPPQIFSTMVLGTGDIGNAWLTSRKVPIQTAPTAIENNVHLFEYFPEAGEYRFLLHYQVPPIALTASQPLLSLKAGGTVHFDIDAGFANAGRPYELVGSTLDPLAGAVHDGLLYPLRPDAYTNAILGGKADSLLTNWRGNLDQHGHARADLIIPPGFRALKPGTSLYHAFLVGNRPFDATSEPVETLLLP